MGRSGIARIDFYFEDWLTGTFELTPEQRGVYITLCALICKTGDRLKDDEIPLARWNGLKVRRWRTVRDELIAAGKITVEGGFIRQSRVADELVIAESRRKMAQEKGQKGGQNRIKTDETQTPNPLINNERDPSRAQATYSNSNTNRSKIEESHTNGEYATHAPTREAADAGSACVIPADDRRYPLGASEAPLTPKPEPEPATFKMFWEAYPKRVGRRDALKAYRSALKRAHAAQIYAGLGAALKFWQARKTEPQFVPNPSTWLNQDRWLDEPLKDTGQIAVNGRVRQDSNAKWEDTKRRQKAQQQCLDEGMNPYTNEGMERVWNLVAEMANGA